jgi:hypothetical protein
MGHVRHTIIDGGTPLRRIRDCVNLPPELTDIAEAILDQDIVTFTDFLEY